MKSEAQRLRELYTAEFNRNCKRYPLECGECKTRQATPEEIIKYGIRSSVKNDKI